MCSCMRTAMDVSDEASSEVEPSDVASFAVGDTFSSYIVYSIYRQSIAFFCSS